MRRRLFDITLVCLSIYISDTLLPRGNFPPGVGRGRSVSISLFWHSLSAHSILLLSTLSLQYSLVDSLHRWSSPDTPSLNPSLIHSSQIHSPSFSSCVQTISMHHASPTPPLHTRILSLSHPHQNSHTHSHYFLHPILTHHKHLLCNSIPLYVFSIAVLHSMSTSDACDRVSRIILLLIPLYTSLLTHLSFITPPVCPSLLFPSPHLSYSHSYLKLFLNI